MKKYIMALDAGTTSCRCIIFDHSGNIISMAQKEFTQLFPKAGWVEHDPTEIWSTQLGVCVEAMAKISASASDIDSIGITNQRETTVIWDKTTGQPIYNAIVWQCRRTSEMSDKLESDGYNELIREKTGLIIDPYYSATKIRWILDNVEGAQERAESGELLFGTIDTWLIWKLTKGKVHVTDYSNASRTMLFNIKDLEWDKELLEIFNIPESILPEVKQSSYKYGYTASNLFGGEILISGAGGDQACSLFGQTCFEKGEAKNTYGTGSFLLMNTGNEIIKSKKGLTASIAWGLDDKITYALEGAIFVAGSAIQWLRDNLRLLDASEDSEYLATKVEDSGGVFVVPAFSGLGAPYWDPYARGIIIGITRSTTKHHIARATLESIAFLSNDVLRTMSEELGEDIKVLRVDGGASANNFLMQVQADITQTIIDRPEILETTALGAVYLAGLASGYWSSIEEIKKQRKLDKIFEPEISLEERDKRDRNWQRAVDRSMAWAKNYEE